MWRIFRRSSRAAEGFSQGERVIFVVDGTTGTVNVPGATHSHVYWDDEPIESSGGSRVRNSDLRRVPNDAPTAA